MRRQSRPHPTRPARRSWILLGCVLAVAALVMVLARPAAERAVRAPARPERAPNATADGAVKAAIDYLRALRWDVLVDDPRRRRAIERRATPEAAAGLDAQLAGPARALRAAVTARPVVARTAVLGYRVERFSARAAVVSIWGMALFATRTYRATTQWSTSRISLVRRNERWLVSAVRSRGGPAPDFPLQALARADARYRKLRHEP